MNITATAEDSASSSSETASESDAGRGYALTLDPARDSRLTEFGKETLRDRYLLPGESYQDLFARVASAYADDAAHAQRLYDYISNLWFMPATPVLSNGGTGRGLPISCYLNSVSDSLEGIVGTWNENVWLASRGGGIGTVGGFIQRQNRVRGKTILFERAHQLRHVDLCCIMVNRHRFFGKINARAINAIRRAKQPFDLGDAACAMHAGDGEARTRQHSRAVPHRASTGQRRVHSNAHAVRRGEDARRHFVAAREDRGRWLGKREQCLGRGGARLEIELTGKDERGVEPDARGQGAVDLRPAIGQARAAERVEHEIRCVPAQQRGLSPRSNGLAAPSRADHRSPRPFVAHFRAVFVLSQREVVIYSYRFRSSQDGRSRR